VKNRGISYIVSVRGRRDMFPGFIRNIKEYNEDFEIIFCCQDDNLLFRKGQLANLGYKKAKKDLISFINIDFRFLEFVPIVEEMNKIDAPVITFLYAAKVREGKDGKLLETTQRGKSQTPGGCQVFTRNQFERCGGHTNLIMGWGIDDVVVNYRVKQFSKFRYLPYCMGHVEHDKFVEYPRREYVKGRNTTVAMNPPSDPKFDSFMETIAEESGKTVLEDNVFEFKFRNIGVPDNFVEMKRYKEQLAMERDVLNLRN